MKRSIDYVKKARQMEHLMRQRLEDYRKDVMLREFIGFEDCYHMFLEFYSDAIKKKEDEQGND